MKSRCIFALLLLPLLFACNKPEPEPQKPPINGRLNAVKNGEAWEAFAHGAKSLDTLKNDFYFSAKDVKTGLTHQFTVNNIPFAKDIYMVKTKYDFSNQNDSLIYSTYYIVDYDLGLADYRLLDRPGNVFHLTHVDSVTRHFSGTLDLEFIVINKADDLGLPDTIRIKNGVFFGEVLR